MPTLKDAMVLYLETEEQPDARALVEIEAAAKASTEKNLKPYRQHLLKSIILSYWTIIYYIDRIKASNGRRFRQCDADANPMPCC